MKYREEKKAAYSYKVQYLDGINALIQKFDKECEEKRDVYTKDILTDPERYRMDLANLIGWPLPERLQAQKAGEKPAVPEGVVTELLSREEGYTVSRMQIPVFEGIALCGLLLRHDDGDGYPFALVQHGGLGTPERITGFYEDTQNYNNMVHRTFEKGVNVFVPQLLLWSQWEYELDFDRYKVDARLKSAGSSIAAIEIYALMRTLDYFEAQDWVGTLGMVGLSYGGFYTLFTSALDTRIKAAVSSSFFCDISAFPHCQSDFIWTGMRECFADAEVACLVYPRKLFVGMGREDELFDSSLSVREFERVRKICGEENLDWIEFTLFEGVHEFYPEDEPLVKWAPYLK